MYHSIPERFQREMGYTQTEFLRTIPRALHGYDYHIETNGVSINLTGTQVEIRFGAQQERRLGHFQLPYLVIDFNFSGTTPDSRVKLMKQFDLYFKKGGG